MTLYSLVSTSTGSQHRAAKERESRFSRHSSLIWYTRSGQHEGEGKWRRELGLEGVELCSTGVRRAETQSFGAIRNTCVIINFAFKIIINQLSINFNLITIFDLQVIIEVIIGGSCVNYY